MWAMTGMPAAVMAAICPAQRRPPSSFTAWQPPSFMYRTAVRRAWVGPSSYEPNGMSPTTRARLVARTTARTSGNSSSTVMGSVVSWP
jgi:hypothetical protein